MTSVARSSNRRGLDAVLEWYRQRLTFPRWGNRSAVVVPADYAGWVVARAGEPQDSDGCRPMGAVRADLLALLDEHTAGMPRERAAFGAVWGLTEWPDVAVSRPITRRLPVQRRRRDAGGVRQELTRERVAQLAAGVLRRMDTPEARRPAAQATSAGPVPDPMESSWLVESLTGRGRRARLILEDAVDAARLFLTRTGTTGAVDPVLAELDRYTAVWRTALDAGTDEVLGQGTQRRRSVSTSRVRGLVGVEAWQVLHRRRSPPGVLLLPEPVRPAALGALRPPPSFTPVAPVVALLLDGDTGTEVLAACCDEVNRLSRADPQAATVITDLLLACYPMPGKPAVDADVAARILQTAIRHRSTDEDWTAVALAAFLARAHPRSHRTVDALMYAIPVATAHSRWTVAEQMLHRMETMLLAGITVPVGRTIAVETVEYRMWTWHQRTATLRRRLQEEGHRLSPRSAQEALREQSRALRDLDLALELNDTLGPGDASESWRHILLIRHAELQLAAADLTSGLDAEIHRRRAENSLDKAAAMQRDGQAPAGDSAAFRKAQLSLAIRRGDDGHAATVLTDLHQVDRWPLHRTVPEVSQIAAGRPNRLIGPVLRAAIRDLDAAEHDGSWQAAVDPANRTRRARAG